MTMPSRAVRRSFAKQSYRIRKTFVGVEPEITRTLA